MEESPEEPVGVDGSVDGSVAIKGSVGSMVVVCDSEDVNGSVAGGWSVVGGSVFNRSSSGMDAVATEYSVVVTSENDSVVSGARVESSGATAGRLAICEVKVRSHSCPFAYQFNQTLH